MRIKLLDEKNQKIIDDYREALIEAGFSQTAAKNNCRLARRAVEVFGITKDVDYDVFRLHDRLCVKRFMEFAVDGTKPKKARMNCSREVKAELLFQAMEDKPQKKRIFERGYGNICYRDSHSVMYW